MSVLGFLACWKEGRCTGACPDNGVGEDACGRLILGTGFRVKKLLATGVLSEEFEENPRLPAILYGYTERPYDRVTLYLSVMYIRTLSRKKCRQHLMLRIKGALRKVTWRAYDHFHGPERAAVAKGRITWGR